VHVKEIAVLCFVIAVLMINFPVVFAAEGNAAINISGTNTLTVGRWDLPWPFDQYSINFYAIPSFDGSNTVSWTVDKDLISPGDNVSSTVNLMQSEHYYRMDFRVIVMDESTGDAVLDETIGTDLGAISVPGSWSSSSLAVPIVPFEIVGIPVELNIYFRFSLSSQYSLTLSTYGLQPQTVTLEYSSNMEKTVEFDKPSGAGAEIFLTSAEVETEGSIIVSAGLSLIGFPTPLKIDFATVPIVGWITQRSKNINMATLKTSIEIEASVSKTLVTLGEYVSVSGRVIPEASDIPIQIMAANAIVGTDETQEDGSFSFDWQPTYAGTVTIQIQSAETKYTTSASSSAFEIRVNQPPQTSFTYLPSNPSILDEIHFTDHSLDLDGELAGYFWEFGDGYTSTITNPIHKYEEAGNYSVRLTVTDDEGATDTTSQTITVKEQSVIPWAPLITIAIAVVIIVGAALFISKKRKPT